MNSNSISISGVLYTKKNVRFRTKWKERYYKTAYHYLFYFKDKNSSQSKGCIDILNVKEVSKECEVPEKIKGMCFSITEKDQTIIFRCTTTTNRDEWVLQIEKMIKECIGINRKDRVSYSGQVKFLQQKSALKKRAFVQQFGYVVPEIPAFIHFEKSHLLKKRPTIHLDHVIEIGEMNANNLVNHKFNKESNLFRILCSDNDYIFEMSTKELMTQLIKILREAAPRYNLSKKNKSQSKLELIEKRQKIKDSPKTELNQSRTTNNSNQFDENINKNSNSGKTMLYGDLNPKNTKNNQMISKNNNNLTKSSSSSNNNNNNNNNNINNNNNNNNNNRIINNIKTNDNNNGENNMKYKDNYLNTKEYFKEQYNQMKFDITAPNLFNLEEIELNISLPEHDFFIKKMVFYPRKTVQQNKMLLLKKISFLNSQTELIQYQLIQIGDLNKRIYSLILIDDELLASYRFKHGDVLHLRKKLDSLYLCDSNFLIKVHIPNNSDLQKGILINSRTRAKELKKILYKKNLCLKEQLKTHSIYIKPSVRFPLGMKLDDRVILLSHQFSLNDSFEFKRTVIEMDEISILKRLSSNINIRGDLILQAQSFSKLVYAILEPPFLELYLNQQEMEPYLSLYLNDLEISSITRNRLHKIEDKYGFLLKYPIMTYIFFVKNNEDRNFWVEKLRWVMKLQELLKFFELNNEENTIVRTQINRLEGQLIKFDLNTIPCSFEKYWCRVFNRSLHFYYSKDNINIKGQSNKNKVNENDNTNTTTDYTDTETDEDIKINKPIYTIDLNEIVKVKNRTIISQKLIRQIGLTQTEFDCCFTIINENYEKFIFFAPDIKSKFQWTRGIDILRYQITEEKNLKTNNFKKKKKKKITL
ncbi:sesquipedalian [Anaeramoeba flamelloides]|uniref:Sesquipedalian n=1 Tax=Anaeramoeba flamelloides TaxID=1746091 RepID=A0AAV8A489_9EUKA|nr:sesquipedalian [Anaeramoeba flamelloides]